MATTPTARLAERSEADDPRIGSDGVRDRHRRQAEDVFGFPPTTRAPMSATADAESVSRRTAPARSGRRHSSAAASVPVAVPAGTGTHARAAHGDDRVNAERCARSPTTAAAARKSCDSGRDLDPATANIADELSQQYYLGYSSTTKKDGRWHAIRVETRDKSLRVRARRGYIATP